MTATETHTVFFALLRSGLWNRPIAGKPILNRQTDWNALLTIARQQTVVGLVADAIFRLPPEEQPDKQTLLRLNTLVTATARKHAILNHTLAEVVSLLEQEGVHPVLLKGQGVAENYPQPTLRQCGDIDLYTGKEDYTRACRLMQRLIDAKSPHAALTDVKPTESVKHFHTVYNGVEIELHRIAETLFNPWQNRRFQQWSRACLHRGRTLTASIGDKRVQVQVPPADFNVLYIFNHLWHHFISGGIGLRQLCDWVMALHTHSGEINRRELKRKLQAFGLWDAWQSFGCIAVDYLGLPEEEFPFYGANRLPRAEKILSRILQEGNFGKYTSSLKNRPEGMIRGKLHSLRRSSRRMVQMTAVSPLRSMEYYVYFLFMGIKGLSKALLGIKTTYMTK